MEGSGGDNLGEGGEMAGGGGEWDGRRLSHCLSVEGMVSPSRWSFGLKSRAVE